MAHACSCGHHATPEVLDTDAAARVDPTQTVAEMLGRSPATDAVFARFGIDRCCGGRLTLREAAATAGIAVETLTGALEVALEPPAPAPATEASADPRPAALVGLRSVAVDVRDDIRRGVEPFARIMAAVKALADGEALLLRAPFEPVPLYGVLGKRGLAHWTERHAEDDWSVFFYRETPPTDVLDVRGLEPPQPMLRVLERAEALRPGESFVVVHDRRPLFLYPQLEDRGFAHETTDTAPGEVRITIRRSR